MNGYECKSPISAAMEFLNYSFGHEYYYSAVQARMRVAVTCLVRGLAQVRLITKCRPVIFNTHPFHLQCSQVYMVYTADTNRVQLFSFSDILRVCILKMKKKNSRRHILHKQEILLVYYCLFSQAKGVGCRNLSRMLPSGKNILLIHEMVPVFQAVKVQKKA
jgi:hypothetical protein